MKILVNKLLVMILLSIVTVGLGSIPDASAEVYTLPSKGWEKTFGGSSFDGGLSVQMTSDGGYISTGSTDSYGAGSADVYLVKTDGLGNKQWEKTFGGPGRDIGFSVQQTSDGGYIIAGSTIIHHGKFGSWNHVYLIKTDGSGIKQWERTFADGIGHSVQQTSDGGYIIAGSTGSYNNGQSDVYLIKTDASGNKQWEKTYGGIYDDYGYSVQQTGGKFVFGGTGYIIVGQTNSYGAGFGSRSDVYLIKTDTAGNELWSQNFGGSEWDSGNSVQQTSDGGYIITGHKNYDIYLIKTNGSGTLQWEKTYGDDPADWGSSVQQTSDGGYIIAGVTGSMIGGYYGNGYLLKMDNSGIKQWDATYKLAHFYSVKQTSNNDYIVVGNKNTGNSTDLYLVKYYRLPELKPPCLLCS
ncbi:hypothetical protein [Paenibacillus spongiae]|uniref:Uncharacterized protein n=1 Tax=Paenibacillus spongiae TaxID=2909671 RepID=A0ABY5SHG2_9BACL|nr:hypothetical protein [Paenibacillus spongiae]UVI33431.1 hypothetical protein L1F29_17010 [Paenibacillus spongiae]